MSLPKWIIIALFVAALVGFADSSYLTAQHARGVLPPCGVSRCDLVLASSYATIAGIPVAALGMLYYGTVLVMLIAYWDTSNRRFVHAACWIISAGMLGTLYFLAVQAFVLDYFCLYCLVSAAATTAMFGIAVYTMRLD